MKIPTYRKLRIAIAGASGFVGQQLIHHLAENHKDIEIVGFSRNGKLNDSKIIWRKCDLFNPKECEEALHGVDVAIYLVHSMTPTAWLDQGSFEDYDVILADNFSKACRNNGVQQIIYLGGILPDNEKMSTHLKSRWEIEQTLATAGVPTTSLRAGLILGSEGSSFKMLVSLIHRLPIIGIPEILLNQTMVVDLENVVKSIVFCINNEQCFQRTFNISGQEITTYENLIYETIEVLEEKKVTFYLKWIPESIMKSSISFITQAPKSLVDPLVESLQHPIVSKVKSVPFYAETNYKKSLKKYLSLGLMEKKPYAFYSFKNILQKKEVRSVQRLHLPEGYNADSVSFAYLHWLTDFLSPFLRTEKKKNFIMIYFWVIRIPLLVLEHNYQRSAKDCQFFFIRGGLLASKKQKGRLEFREVLGGRHIIAAIHEFTPALPWWIYIITQAPMHAIVMKAFNRWLERITIRKNSQQGKKVVRV